MLRTYRTTSAEEILLSWLVRMPPNVWRLGYEPSTADQQRWPGKYLVTTDDWWGPRELADTQLAALRDQYARSPHLAHLDPGSRFLVGQAGFAFGTPPMSVAACVAVTALRRLRRR